MMKSNSQQFMCKYKRTEAPVLVPIEHKLMKELGMDRSGVHKHAIRQLYNHHLMSQLDLI